MAYTKWQPAWRNLPSKTTPVSADALDHIEAGIAAAAATADSAVQPDDLATVATTGAYDDLTNTPTLGTAAAMSIEEVQSALVDGGLAEDPAFTGAFPTRAEMGHVWINPVDDRTAINAEISARASDGGGTVEIPGDEIEVSGPINLASNVNLVGRSTGHAVLTVTEDEEHVISGTGLSDILIRNLTVQGVRSATNNIAGIHFGNCERVHVERVRVYDCLGGAGIGMMYATGNDFSTPTTGSTIDRCEIEACLFGVELMQVQDCTVSKTTILDASLHGIRLAGARQTSILGCHIRNAGAAGSGTRYGIVLSGFGDGVVVLPSIGTVIDGCTIAASPSVLAGIGLSPGSEGCSIVGNTIDGTVYGIAGFNVVSAANNADRLLIAGNTIRNQTRGIALRGKYDGIDINGNRITEWSSSGIHLQAQTSTGDIMHNVDVANNTIVSATGADAFDYCIVAAGDSAQFDEVAVLFNRLRMYGQTSYISDTPSVLRLDIDGSTDTNDYVSL